MQSAPSRRSASLPRPQLARYEAWKTARHEGAEAHVRLDQRRSASEDAAGSGTDAPDTLVQ